MIKLRLNSMNGEEVQEIEIVSGESLEDAVFRIVGHLKTGQPIHNIFGAVLNGHVIESKLWPITRLQTTDAVTIYPRIQGENESALFRTAAIIAVTLVANAYAPGSSVFVNALFTAGVTIGATLLLYQLFPPPVPDTSGLGGSSDLDKSQMYSIQGQSNSVKRFGPVPKVYGTHRMFPTVAANPYIELEADPDTGKPVQYLYCLYDFGLGPAKVHGLQIGETPLENFNNVTYNFVDFNRPDTDEGIWDSGIKKSLSIYKGDVEAESLSIALTGNQFAGDPPANTTVIRNAAPKVDPAPQEITLTFINDRGLYGFSSTGAIGERSIDLQIEFARVGTEFWYPYNDLNFVHSFSSIGGGTAYDEYVTSIWTGIDIEDNNYPLTGPDVYLGTYGYDDSYGNYVYSYRRTRGIPAGATTVILQSGIPNGAYIYIQGNLIGRVQSSTVFTGSYSTYTLESPCLENITFMQWDFKRVGTSGTIIAYSQSINPTTISYRYRIPIIGRGRITRASSTPCYSTFRFTPRSKGNYKVRVIRLQTFGPYTSNTQDNLVLVGLTTRTDISPIVTDKRHIFLEMKIKATDQLNGTISNLSGIVESALEVYDGANWSRQLTSNPAWVFTDILIGDINKRKIDKSKLHLASIKEWADFCDEVPDAGIIWYNYPRFQCNFVFDYDATVQTLLGQVSNAAQASLNIVDGKYGVLVDKLKTVPVQIFTPRNSWGFTVTRNYTEVPHALKVKYIEPYPEWGVQEAVVYDDGYDSVTATKIEDVTSFGCTVYEQAYRFGRFLLAQARLRKEVMSLNVDFEHLICTRGDYVKITQDVMKVGGSPARVRTRTGNQITIDDGIETIPGTYGYTFRALDGDIYTNTLTVVNSDTFDLNGTPLPEPGDLIVIGIVGSITFDCLVKSITPNSDLSATITLIEKSDAVYDSESALTLPIYNPNISPTANAEFLPPGEVENLAILENDWECTGSGYLYYLLIDWDVPLGAAIEAYEIYVDSGQGYDLAGTTRESEYKYEVNQDRLGLIHKVKVIGVSATGKKKNLGEVSEVTATPLPKTTPPSNVESLNIDITSEVLQLFWTQVSDCDVQEYLIRYSPDINSQWETSIPLLRVDRNTTLASAQARTGRYFIKAVDFNSNESSVATSAVTTIPELFGLNVIDETTDFPTLPGNKDRVVSGGGGLVLQKTVVGGVETTEYNSEGYYYYENLLDLGEIYSVRLQSLVQAEGYTLEDLMSNWVTLDQVILMSNSKFSEWDVQTQYRTTENLNLISEWNPMSDVLTMSGGDEDIWSPWRTFSITEATGRIFQFRLRLISNKTSVTPRVFDGTIKADMPDRVESFENISVPDTGYSFTYTPAFKGPGTSPNIQVSIDNFDSGDYWTITNKTLEGFDIMFFDKNDVAVAKTCDIVVKGYGRQAISMI